MEDKDIINSVSVNFFIRTLPFVFMALTLFFSCISKKTFISEYFVVSCLGVLGIILFSLKLDYVKKDDNSYYFTIHSFKSFIVLEDNIKELNYYKKWDYSDGISYVTFIEVELFNSVSFPFQIKNCWLFSDLSFDDKGDLKKFTYRAPFSTITKISRGRGG